MDYSPLGRKRVRHDLKTNNKQDRYQPSLGVGRVAEGKPELLARNEWEIAREKGSSRHGAGGRSKRKTDVCRPR